MAWPKGAGVQWGGPLQHTSLVSPGYDGCTCDGQQRVSSMAALRPIIRRAKNFSRDNDLFFLSVLPCLLVPVPKNRERRETRDGLATKAGGHMCSNTLTFRREGM